MEKPAGSLQPIAAAHLGALCDEIGPRPVGSSGNQAATDYVAKSLAAQGWAVESPSFECLDWRQEGAELMAPGRAFTVSPSPYALGCQVEARLAVVSTLAELEAVEADGQVLLVRGDLAQEQLMPKRFPFYNPEEHQRIIALLEARRPAALVTATGRNPATSGALYPFPLIEDGDFDIPSVYTTEEEGDRLAEAAGQCVALTSRARRIPSTGCNVIGRRRREEGPRLVVCAHLDSKLDTPGALDNAAGVVTLLLLAELLSDAPETLPIELLAMNGEDYYAASGEIQYLERNAGRLDDILLAVNLDAAGYHEGATAYSLYACPDALAARIRRTWGALAGLVEGEPWYQSDHTMFAQHGVPAVAVTSERYMELAATLTHTSRDTTQMVSLAKLVQLALALRDLIGTLGKTGEVARR